LFKEEEWWERKGKQVCEDEEQMFIVALSVNDNPKP
jgi:hypothetical protein